MRIAIGSDHAGFSLKGHLIEYLSRRGIDVVDMGCPSMETVHYPEIAKKVVNALSEGSVSRGILVCGSGIGMSMVANRFRGIRAALCNDLFSARLSREHNDANVLCMGARIIAPPLAEAVVEVWIETPFAEGRHAERIAMFDC